MEKLSICRVCLDSNTQHAVVDPQLQDLYQRLTSIPFQMSDMRPLALCYICHGQLNAARRLMLKCLKAEELLTEMLNRVAKEDEVQTLFPIDRSALQELSYSIVPVVYENSCEDLDIDVKDEIFKIYETNVELEEVMQEIVNSIDFKLDTEANLSDQKDNILFTDIKENGEATREQTEAAHRQRKRKRVKRAARIVKTPKIKLSKKFKFDPSDFKSSPTQFRCNQCNRNFKEKCFLIAHNCKKTFHPYTCSICDKTFTEKRKLAKHSFIHTLDKSYLCNVCKKTFRSKYYLRLHSRIHTGVRPCVCDVCNKGFTTMMGLNVHYRIHTGVRPYVCKVCDKRFVVHGHVVRHARIHTGEKPFVCDICHKSFNQNCTMLRHVQQMHVKKDESLL